MTISAKHITAEELLAMGDIGRCELINGEVVHMSPSGFEHGHVAARLAKLLDNWNDQTKAGIVLGAETGFILKRDPDTVRAPDVAFVQAARIGSELPKGFFEGAPNLAMEVVSPGDSWPEVQEKVELWLSHGCNSCWVVDPKNRQVTIHRKDGSIAKFQNEQEVEDSTVPGFRIKVAAVFEW